MRKLIVRGKAAMNRVKMISVTAVKSGEGYLDVLIKILITVIIGAALLALMRVAIPELFNDIINKIKSVFTI
ncbi:MAG TPA: hypothetical protein DD391_08940 [Clostridiales bacterium]|jgi:hypothetical protein|nr:hypothetical protein [Clostridiales bacterium]